MEIIATRTSNILEEESQKETKSVVLNYLGGVLQNTHYCKVCKKEIDKQSSEVYLGGLACKRRRSLCECASQLLQQRHSS